MQFMQISVQGSSL